MGRICISSLHLHMLVILAFFAISNAVQSDIDCLRSIKNSLQDPENMLSSWDFISNTSEGFVCGFAGVECWHSDENRILDLRLSDMGLRGAFPLGIKNCTSLTGLDLSSNQLHGSLPTDISEVIPFVTSLDLSYNNFSGPIPPTISNCSFINTLTLNNNHLTGEIPPELGLLNRIKDFRVSNNRLSGQVPFFNYYSIPSENLSNNLRLCGRPLGPCKNAQGHVDPFVFGFAVGFPFSAILSTLLMCFCFPRGAPRLSISLIYSYLFVTLKPIKGRGQTLTLMYKAMFPNGLILAVKRLHKFENFEKEFLLEIEILGRLRHTNLMPLLGFCFEKGKKFLVYKYMSNRTLYQWLHYMPQVEGKKMGWTLRFRIAIGIARGLAWLHHNNVLRVAHCKISSNCILLDDEFEPKISNFGNSNILMNTSSTILSCGNFVAPEYSPSPYREDVYSFGIVLLELITGTEPSSWSNSARELNVIDGCLADQGFDEEIYGTLRLAEDCIRAQNDTALSMLQVYQAMCDIAKWKYEISLD